MSKVIRKIEEEVGFELFSHFKSAKKLTDQGAMLYDKALRVINEYDSIIECTRLEKEHLSGPGVSRFSRCGRLLLSVRHYCGVFKQYPGIHLSTSEKGTQRVINDVEGGALTWALLWPLCRRYKFDCTPLFRDTNYIVVSAEHPLASRKKWSWLT